jgi:acetolactate synthase-1/3 small subunit
MAIRNAHANKFAGLMALPRSPLHGSDEVETKDAEDIVDSSLLPPG